MLQMKSDHIVEILAVRGQQQYDGESVSQPEHALQCAALAQADNASQELITACLLHDLGHLIDIGSDIETHSQLDRRHEYRGATLLQTLFSPAVTEPIRLHVGAKQYLCAVDPDYWKVLSPASQHSLKQQGGIFSAEATQQFIAQPFAQDAIKLRVWDDLAKVVGAQTPDFEDLITIVQNCVCLIDS
jgi:phosphonate degradation associated HDIG domain protein